jgi:hypothetical protein
VLPSDGDAHEAPQSWLARSGAVGWRLARVGGGLAIVFPVAFGATLGVSVLRGVGTWIAVPIALVVATVLTAAAGRFILGFGDGMAAVAAKAVMPSGRSTPYEEQYSYQESLAARGDVAGALESYEAVIAERADAVLPRIRAAELYAKANRDPRRAAELFRAVRDHPHASTRDALYAANRLVDLYDGPLGEPGRALVELRRLADRFPGTPAADRARQAIRTIKARMTEGQG